MAVKGRNTVWNLLRGNHLGQRHTRQNRPDIWMQTIKSHPAKPCEPGAVHIWVPAFAGMSGVGGDPPSWGGNDPAALAF
jgi:hypothetical protein